LQKARKEWPSEGKVYVELGYAQQYSNDPDNAIVNYNKALELDGDQVLAYRYLGNIYCNVKDDYQNALTNYLKYIKDLTDVDEVIYYNIGFCENELGNYDDAVLYLKKAVDEKTDDADAYYEMGWAYYKLNQGDEAIDAFTNSKYYKPDNYRPYLGLGNVYRDLKNKTDDALNYYTKALSLNPKSESANYGVGWCYNDKSEYDQAVPFLKKAIELYDQYNVAMTELGYSYYKLNRYNDGLNILQKSKNIKETNLSLYYSGLCYVSLNQKTDAMNIYNKMQKNNFSDASNLLAKINAMQ
jgi:tetratricopeptide (TPR) repeat protein